MPETTIQIAISGRQLNVDSILLHSASGVRKWQAMLAKAQPLLSGFTTGIGVWGSPGVALAGAAAIGMLEAAVTNANQKQGLQLMVNAAAYFDRLKARGEFIVIDEIGGIENPDPSQWYARGIVDSEVDLTALPKYERERVTKEYDVSPAEQSLGIVTRKTMQDLAVLPSEFLTCTSSNIIMSFRWASVDIYQPAIPHT